MILPAAVVFGLVLVAFAGLPDAKDLPGIIGTGGQGAGHFIAVLEIRGDEIVFVDPLSGKKRMSVERFLMWHQLEPFFMSIQPQG